MPGDIVFSWSVQLSAQYACCACSCVKAIYKQHIMAYFEFLMRSLHIRNSLGRMCMWYVCGCCSSTAGCAHHTHRTDCCTWCGRTRATWRATSSRTRTSSSSPRSTSCISTAKVRHNTTVIAALDVLHQHCKGTSQHHSHCPPTCIKVTKCTMCFLISS